MIKGSKTYINKQTGEEKQICPKCGKKMPTHYFKCFECPGKESTLK